MRPVPQHFHLAHVLGNGSVFETAAVTDAAGTELVLKRPAQRLVDFRDAVGALAREREILQAARGCHVPRVVEAATDDHGPYLVETRAPGLPLREMSRRGPLAANDWLAVARAASRALARLHELVDEKGPVEIVHGDLSPDNLLVAEDRRVTFVDLATGTFRDGRTPVFPHGRGTLPYVAPEIARAERPVDQAADVYALMAVLLWLAVGPIVDAAHEAGRLQEVGSRGVRTEWIDHRTDLPAGARAAVRSGLVADRAGRVSVARELAARIEER